MLEHSWLQLSEPITPAAMPIPCICPAAVFPVGVYTGATCLLARTTHSNGFAVAGAIFVGIHVVLWLVVSTLTVRQAWTGRLFHAPDLAPVAARATSAVDGSESIWPEGLRTASQLDEQLANVLIGGGGSGSRCSSSSSGYGDRDETEITTSGLPLRRNGLV